MHEKLVIHRVDELPSELNKIIQKGHEREEAALGIRCDFKKFSLVLKTDRGIPVGALSAFTVFAEIYIEDLWVDPKYRKYGYGRALLEEIYNSFKDKGYNNINLITSEFQAPDFYKKCGFELEFVRLNKINPQLNKYFFVRFFNNNKQTRGLI
jgi:ribosomal protein S18 acetylase RimI-like enzyme